MRLLLLVAVTSVIGTSTVCARSQMENHQQFVFVEPSDTLSADSLQTLYSKIDQLSVFELPKWRESYIYKNRIQPCNQNKQILLYIEERMKVVK